jgi:hypothetical protein
MTNTINKLSHASHQLQSLWKDLDQYVENAESEVVVELISHLQESIPELVDYVVEEMDGLEISLVGAEAELNAAKEKYQSRVDAIKKEIQSRTNILLKLRGKGILSDEVLGETKKISFQLNPPRVEELLIEPSSPEFPSEFLQTRVEYIPLKKEILEAHKKGEDVSKTAKISRGISVRFKSRPS